MKLKKILIYVTIFTMVFHFSIPQALASKVDGSEVGIDSEDSEEVHVDEPDVENTENDEEQKHNLNEAENKNLEELPYTEEDSHEQIIIIKEKLHGLGFDELEEPEVFDEFMAEQVKEFQHYYELEVTGEVDELTLEKLNEVYHSELQKGNEHTETIRIKEMLSALGYDELEEGQVFGELTEASLKAFQNDHDLLVHGIVDEPTLALLEEGFESLEMSLEDGSEEQVEEAASKETEDPTEVEEESADTTTEEFTTEEETKNRSLQRSESPMSTEPPYENGDNHPDIAEMKVKLNALGFDGLTTNGAFGNWTETRVAEFQEYYELPSTGVVDQDTLDRVSEVYNSPYQNGESNQQSSEIKIMLSDLGYSGLNSGPFFGNLTETRLKEFQRDHGLMDHGIGDSVTISKLEELYNPEEFSNGDNHPEISTMKRMLNALGFDGLTTNGAFGNWTETRVAEFQEYYGLPSTGVADQDTLDRVSEVYNSPYQNGESNQQSSEIKIMLSDLGYSGLNSGPFFGNLTETRLKEFQRDNGLMDHGIADEPTIAKLEELYNADEFRNGDNHPEISTMKRMLNALGFDGLTTNGAFGNWTETRVTQFQEYYGLPSTGVADQDTLDKVSAVYNSPYQNGNSNERSSEIKIMLSELGYIGLNSGPVFGNLTETRLKEFQRDYELMDHGIADEPTIDKLEEVHDEFVFKNGDTSPEIAEMKRKLNRLGFDGLSTNDVFGNWTETRVSDFQAYYGLTVTGIADYTTQEKIDDVYNSPYQNGNSDPYISEIKQMLTILQYNGLNSGPVFGNLTETRVREFQENHDLVVNGIVDEVTNAKLLEVFGEDVTKINITLQEALDMQVLVGPQTDKYRNDSAYISSNYASVNGVLSGNANIRTGPTTNSNSVALLSGGSSITMLDKIQNNSGYTWYKILYDGQERYVSGNLVTNIKATVDSNSNLNVRQEPNTNNLTHIYGVLPSGSEVQVLDFHSNGHWLEIQYGTWRNATSSDTFAYLDPAQNDKFQHLDLSMPVGATAAELNSYLSDKGVLRGMGQAFVDAANEHNINELYLVSHAILETGHGTSNLATGIRVNGTTVYNMFGIGAVDACPDSCGAERAYEEGWTSPYKAIVGGAEFIGERYIHNEDNQNTLYKMRWNPQSLKRGVASHQYATDIAWATKQVSSLKNMHNEILDNPLLRFNIVEYR